MSAFNARNGVVKAHLQVLDGGIRPRVLEMHILKDKIVLKATQKSEELILRDLKIELGKIGTPVEDPHNLIEEGGGIGPVEQLIFNLN